MRAASDCSYGRPRKHQPTLHPPYKDSLFIRKPRYWSDARTPTIRKLIDWLGRTDVTEQAKLRLFLGRDWPRTNSSDFCCQGLTNEIGHAKTGLNVRWIIPPITGVGRGSERRTNHPTFPSSGAATTSWLRYRIHHESEVIIHRA